MASNGFGLIYRFTSWGESHGPEIGVVLDGVPAGLRVNLEGMQQDLQRRRPGQPMTSQRQENDRLEVVSGLLRGVSTGAPIAFRVTNEDARSRPYQELESMYRPSHAEYSWEKKYGLHDISGGGRSSARETIARVLAGSLARQFLKPMGIQIQAELLEVGGHRQDLIKHIENARALQDSIGGVVQARATGVPVGIGEPIYEKLDARLAYAMMSLPASKAFEIGEGTAAGRMSGSEHNDEIGPNGFYTNHAGGVLGGVSNGETIELRVTFKPTASIFRPQRTVNRQNEACILKLKGRHDPCVALRAVVVVEAMLAQVLMDLILMGRTRT